MLGTPMREPCFHDCGDNWTRALSSAQSADPQEAQRRILASGTEATLLEAFRVTETLAEQTAGSILAVGIEGTRLLWQNCYRLCYVWAPHMHADGPSSWSDMTRVPLRARIKGATSR